MIQYRNKCIICKSNLELSYSFSKFPIFMGTTDQPRETDVCEDLNFSTCTNCGCVQLSNLIPLDVLYEKSHNAAVGKTWDKHHLEFYNFIKNYTKGTIVEIGGGNLHLARHLENEASIDKIVIYDTNTYGEINSDKIEMREEFFDSRSTQGLSIDMVIHSHLMEHLYNPIEEIQSMSDTLQEGGYMAIAIPLINNMLEDKFTNAMNFEHTYMITENIYQDILNKANLEIVATKDFSKYTRFLITKKNTGCDLIFRSYPECIGILDNFVKYYSEEVNNIKEILELDYSKENTFIFGAHIFTQYLIKFGLNEGLFSNILDNDDRKIGNRLYGTDLIVKSPKILKDIENPILVLKAAQYTEEIKKDILENINPNTRFIL